MVECGACHSLILTTDHKILSFGDNSSGQLGLGHKIDQDNPQLIESLNDVKKCSGAGCHTLVLTKDRRLYSFGCNQNGRLGLGLDQFSDESNPRLIETLHNVKY